MSQVNRVSILGGAGFLGTRLSKRFRAVGQAHNICDLAVVDEAEQVIITDIEDRESLECVAHSDCIINLAAMHRDDVRPITRYDDVNVQGSVNVCDAARKYGVRKIIFTSSVAVYGFAPPNTDETGEPNYFNDYGRTKYLAEKVYKEWQAEDPEGRTLVIVRPTVIFGEGNRGNVYNLLRQVASRRFVMFGDGKNKKSMAYVENVAAFIAHCVHMGPGVHTYNYIDKPDMSMNELVATCRKALFGRHNVGLRLPAFLGVSIGWAFDLFSWFFKRPLPVSSIRVKKFMATTQFSSAVADTDFKAPYTLAEGLEKTLRYEFLEDNTDKPTYETE